MTVPISTGTFALSNGAFLCRSDELMQLMVDGGQLIVGCFVDAQFDASLVVNWRSSGV